MAYKICIIGGDGIGPELVGHALDVLSDLSLSVELIHAQAGYACYQKQGTPLPKDTLESARQADAILFGAVSTPPNIPNYKSAIVSLRQDLDVYANVRPIRSYSGVPCLRPDINLVIIRENTEGLYAGIEHQRKDGATALRVITRKASQRIAEFAYSYAAKHDRKKVTVVHKANILRQTCGLFREVVFDVARKYPGIETDEALVDTMAMRLIREPHYFSVILTTNLFGDILSDEAAQLAGGMGMACSANIGEKAALFEPVHGSAPQLADKNQANPCATLFSLALLLDHLGENAEAQRVHEAVVRVLAEGTHLTPDLGGTVGTIQMVNAVRQKLKNQN